MKNIILTLLILIFSNAVQSEDTLIIIGVRAHSGVDKAIKKWQPTAQYLTESISGYRFEMSPYVAIEDLRSAVENKDYHFILTNPSSYVDTEVNLGANRIATLKNKRGSEAYTQFGSVIFTRADRSDINQLKDIKDKRFMAVAPKAFGGWRVSLFEFLSNDINPYKDFSEIQFGTFQENVVHAVKDRKVDAGTVRTDMLERMANAGEVKLEDFKVINQKIVNDFSFLLSTSLYPEWPFASLKHTPDKLISKVASALFAINKSHPAAIAGKYDGWTTPLNYAQVHSLLKKLQVSPYDDIKQESTSSFSETYWPWILVNLFVFPLIIMASFYLVRINKTK